MNILLTSIGRRSYIVKYFKDALKESGLVHASNSTKTYALQLADKLIITPEIYDPNYIDFLISYSKKNNIDAIIPMFDIDTSVLSDKKDLFTASYIRVVVSDHNVVSMCNDKWLTHLFLSENGFNSPRTFLTFNDAKYALENNFLKFPLFIKPRWGMGSIGIFEAENANELDVFINKSKKCILNSYLRFESENDCNHCIIIQEKLHGVEYGLDVFNDLEGNFICCVPKKKLSMRAGETDIAEIIEDEELTELGKRLSQTIRHIGNLDVDCYRNNGKTYILEMNCRFGGQYPFAHLAGVNFPKAIVNMLKAEKVGDELLNFKVGTIGIKDLVPVIL